MAWTTPRTWVTGEVVTAALGNTHWRNNLRYLKGLDGTVTLSDGLDLGANELTINSIEIVGVDGEVNKAALEQLDHGADLAGLGGDDHTQYALRSILTTRGDIIYRNATVWARLAKGTSGQVLAMDADDPGWVDSVGDYPMKTLTPAANERWVMPGWYIGGNFSQAGSANQIVYTPIFVSKTTTYIRIAIEVMTAGAGLVDLRIFEWNIGVPGALVLSAGTVDVSSTGIKAITINQELTRGYYFLALRSNVVATFAGVWAEKGVSTPVEGSRGTMGGTQDIVQTISGAYTDPADTPTGEANTKFAFVYLREA